MAAGRSRPSISGLTACQPRPWHICVRVHMCVSLCAHMCYLVCAHVCGACVCTHVWCVSSCMYTWERECVYLCACVHACCVPCVVCVHTCVVCGFHVCALWCVYTVWCVSVRVHVCCPCAVHVWLHVAFMCVHGPSTELPPRPPPLMAAATHACPAGHHPPPEFTLGLCPPTAESAGTHQLAERHPTAPGPLQNPPGPPLNEGLQGSPVSPANTSQPGLWGTHWIGAQGEQPRPSHLVLPAWLGLYMVVRGSPEPPGALPWNNVQLRGCECQLLGRAQGTDPVCKGSCPGGPHMAPSSAHSAQGPRRVWSRWRGR